MKRTFKISEVTCSELLLNYFPLHTCLEVDASG